MPHDSWRSFLPYYIKKYKGVPFDITCDQVQYWYRDSAVSGGDDCDVAGNNAAQNQIETPPNDLVDDTIFISAILQTPAELHVQIGSNLPTTHIGVAGINHWNQPFNGQTGEPKLSIFRNKTIVKSGVGKLISEKTKLSNGCTNYNAWVGSF